MTLEFEQFSPQQTKHPWEVSTGKIIDEVFAPPSEKKGSETNPDTQNFLPKLKVSEFIAESKKLIEKLDSNGDKALDSRELSQAWSGKGPDYSDTQSIAFHMLLQYHPAIQGLDGSYNSLSAADLNYFKNISDGGGLPRLYLTNYYEQATSSCDAGRYIRRELGEERRRKEDLTFGYVLSSSAAVSAVGVAAVLGAPATVLLGMGALGVAGVAGLKPLHDGLNGAVDAFRCRRGKTADKGAMIGQLLKSLDR